MYTKLPKLPIGVQDFESLRTGGYLYVDKTKTIYDLLNKGHAYFISRPRRFGKSLLVSTLEALFHAKKDLFQGLWIENSDYDWQNYPVIKLDFSRFTSDSPENLDSDFRKKLSDIASEHGLEPRGETLAAMIDSLVDDLHKKYKKKVVVLVDEYDAPLIKNINKVELARENRDLLANFFKVIKSQDAKIRFVLLTGVSKFAKVSVFSGLNNLRDISLSTDSAELLGYTQEELELYFKKHLNDSVPRFSSSEAELLEKIKTWYNGYRFSTLETLVYNPFSTLLFFAEKQFRNFWFETATPSFLLDLIRSQNYPLKDFHKELLSPNELSSYEVDRLPLLPLMLHTGYLTISDCDLEEGVVNSYTVDYPNREVKEAFLEKFRSTTPIFHGKLGV